MKIAIICMFLVIGSWMQIDTKVIHYTNKALFLTYHHLDEKESFVTISPMKFNQHLQVLKENHYNVIPIEAYVCFQEHQKSIPPNAVVITFDDGYRSFYEKAYPLLKKQGYAATNFVVVSYIDSDYPALPFLTWNQLKEMKLEGFSFYSHTFNLHRKRKDDAGNTVPILTNRIFLEPEQRLETEEERRKRVRDDLLAGEVLLKTELDNKFSMLCFHFGDYNQSVINEAEQLGFRYFFTTKEDINSGDSREIYRLNVGMPYVTAETFLKKLQSYDRKY